MDINIWLQVLTLSILKKTLNVINNVINHRLSFYGASDLVVIWPRSYLTGKKLRAFVGVPQESILGLFFSICL